MDFNSLTNHITIFGGIALTTIIAALFSQIKQKLLSFLDYLFCVHILEFEYTTHLLFLDFLDKQYRRLKLYPITIESYFRYVRDKKKKSYVFAESYQNNTVFFKNIFPLFVTFSQSEKKSYRKLSFLKFTYNFDKILKEFYEYLIELKGMTSYFRFKIVKKFGSIGSFNSSSSKDPSSSSENQVITSYKESNDNYFGVKLLYNNRENLGESIHEGDPFDFIATSRESETIIKDVESWISNKLWFKERNISWKMGILLHGKPGTGKTCFVRALGEKFDMPIYHFDLATMTNIDLIKAWSDITFDIPCIALFEDLDAIFDGRETRAKDTFHNHLTFDCFLNIVDGVERNDGIITVITTNNLDKMDQAVCEVERNGVIKTRPGRVDKVVEFTYLDEEGKIKISNNILRGYPSHIEKVLSLKGTFTGAQFQQVCIEEGRKIYWENRLKNKAE